MENKSLFTETAPADEFDKYSKVKLILIIKSKKEEFLTTRISNSMIA